MVFQALLDSGASLNLIHEGLVRTLGLATEVCQSIHVTIANGAKLLHANRMARLKFNLAGVEHQETFLVAPLGSNQMILGMPWLERVNPDIDWKKRSLTYREPNSGPSISGTVVTPDDVAVAPPTVLETPTSNSESSQSPEPRPKSRKPRRKRGKPLPCESRPFRRPVARQSRYSIPISLTRHLEKGDLVALAFVSAVAGGEVQVNTLNSDDPDAGLKIPECYKDLSDVFSVKESQSLPPHRGHLDHHIPLDKDAKPVFGPIYNLSELELKVLKKYIEDNLKKQFIRPSTSPFGSPVLFVKKPDGSLRLCVDYRALNRITVKNRHPLPLAVEIMDRIKGATRFTRLDVRDAFNRLRVAEGDEWKTAFRTRYGHFEYLVMPFGLCNAPASFQSYINNALREYLDDFCIAYMDDVLVYTTGTLDEHIQHVRKVLKSLHEHELYVKLEKCEFHVQETKFLGFIISPDGVAMDPDRIKTIVDWPVPKSQYDIQVFLGFANFYRRFIEGYSRVVLPITNLLKKLRKFIWTDKAQAAFDKLKILFTTAPILKHFDPDLEITLHADSSGAALSGIISQWHNGILHPVAFWSRKCTPAECNYDIYDREMLAIVESMKHWRHYLEGAKYPIQIRSDHKNLETFMTTKILSRRQARWAEFLTGYDFVLVHIKGTRNPADGPSRRPDYMENVELPSGTLIPRSALRMLTPQDSQVSALGAYWNSIGVHAYTTPDASLRSRFMAALKGDSVAAKYRDNPPQPWSWQDGLLLRDNLVYVPHDDALRLDLLKMHHDDALAGHFGEAKTLDLLLRNYYFPGIHSYVKKYVSSCDVCSRGKASRHLKHGELAPLPVPSGPWKGISCDFITDLPPSHGYDSIFVVVDRLTKMSHLVPCLKTTTAPQFARMFLDYVIRLHGIPDSIVSDRGSIFTSQFWTALSKSLSLDKRLSTAFHPQTDGQTERTNQTVEQYLRIYCNYHQDNWSELLSLAEFSYNNAQHTSIGCSPFYANYGYNPRFTVDLRQFTKHPVPAAEEMAKHLKAIHENLIELIKVVQNQQAKYYDAKHKRVEYKPGDKVWLLSSNIRTERPHKKLDWKRLGPYLVLERIGTQAYRLQLPPSLKVHPVFHVSLLDRYNESEIPGRVQPPPPPVIVDNQPEYEVEDVLDSRILRNRLYYLVKWKDFPISDNSWEPASHLANCPDLVALFHQRYPEKPSSLLSPTPRSGQPKRKRRSHRVNLVGNVVVFNPDSTLGM
jgi:Reverse transcriptase (RNA-dependent DNA polymerase)/RNase H-like domain found in reverse transcriptase/Integrase zinc binding domain/Chromo (CHRromatin Organisation MOdifier) domain/gag-polyprotein putative aspartyl protease